MSLAYLRILVSNILAKNLKKKKKKRKSKKQTLLGPEIDEYLIHL